MVFNFDVIIQNLLECPLGSGVHDSLKGGVVVVKRNPTKREKYLPLMGSTEQLHYAREARFAIETISADNM